MPKTSIIIPCFNQGKYIEDTIDSVLKQTYQNFEIIVINDGSTDEFTNEILKNLKNEKTKVLHTINKGVCHARNIGVKHATGKYLLFLDADDLLDNTFLEKTLNIFETKSNISIVTTGVMMFDAENFEFKLPEFNFRELLVHNLIVISSLIKTDEFLKTTGFNENMRNGFEDWDFWISFLNINKGCVHRINETLFYYRRLQASRTKSANYNFENLTNQIVKNNSTVYFREYCNLYEDFIKTKNQLILIQNSRIYKFSKKISSIFSFLKRK